MSLKVAIAVHGRFHAFDLASALAREGATVQVSTTYPRWAARRFLPAPVQIRSASWLEYWRRFHAKTSMGPVPGAGLCRAFGRFAAQTFPADADVFVGWSAASLEALAPARRAGILTVVERGSTHILHQRAVLKRVYAENGGHFDGIDPEIVDRELAEYDMADLISVPSQFVASTFISRGFPQHRLLVNPYGVDAARFHCADRRRSDKPAILFVGSVGYRKGAPDLLAAFSLIRHDATLEFVGPVDRGWRPARTDNVKFAGAVSRDGVIAALGRTDIFCLPSHEEGLPLSLLQAMASGLPVVTTPESGAADAITDGVEGRIVPAGNPVALADALSELCASPDLRLEMGRQARKKAAQMKWTDYGNRAIAGYNRAIADRALNRKTSLLSGNRGQ